MLVDADDIHLDPRKGMLSKVLPKKKKEKSKAMKVMKVMKVMPKHHAKPMKVCGGGGGTRAVDGYLTGARRRYVSAAYHRAVLCATKSGSDKDVAKECGRAAHAEAAAVFDAR
jgi:hypothetical protein